MYPSIHTFVYTRTNNISQEHRNIGQAPAPGKKANSYPYGCTVVQKTTRAIPKNKNRGYDSCSPTVAYAV